MKTSKAVLAVSCFLVVAVLAVFGRTVVQKYPFIDFDDGEYVYENSHVTGGLSLGEAGWAFTHFSASNWHPLTWLSHMLDCQIYHRSDQPYQQAAWGHHLTNVLLHAGAAVLLFLALWRLTVAVWPSALVAALFAIHPLRVESVAWISERKDVLSGLFFMLTLLAYAGYARRPSVLRCFWVVLAYALGLLAKPMLVTLPFVLLLLDYWPLGRLAGWRRCFAEKIPLFVLAAASCVVTVLAQRGVIAAVERLSFQDRAANALVSLVAYLGKFLWPTNLAIFYPHPQASLESWKVVGALALLAAVTAVAAVWRRKYPHLIVGWLWYLGMLVPVIGLVQVGGQAMADRYTYLPNIGLGIALAWSLAVLVARRPALRTAAVFASAAAIVVLMAWAWRQTGFWRDSEDLWRRAVDCTERNSIAHNSLAPSWGSRQKAARETSRKP